MFVNPFGRSDQLVPAILSYAGAYIALSVLYSVLMSKMITAFVTTQKLFSRSKDKGSTE